MSTPLTSPPAGTPLPRWAARLRYAGLIPFVALAAAAWLAPAAHRAAMVGLGVDFTDVMDYVGHNDGAVGRHPGDDISRLDHQRREDDEVDERPEHHARRVHFGTVSDHREGGAQLVLRRQQLANLIEALLDTLLQQVAQLHQHRLGIAQRTARLPRQHLQRLAEPVQEDAIAMAQLRRVGATPGATVVVNRTLGGIHIGISGE